MPRWGVELYLSRLALIILKPPRKGSFVLDRIVELLVSGPFSQLASLRDIQVQGGPLRPRQDRV